MKKLNHYLTIGDAASYLGVSKDTLRRWDSSGKLTAHRHPVTHFRLYLKEDLDAILTGVARPEAGNPRAGKSKQRANKRGR